MSESSAIRSNTVGILTVLYVVLSLAVRDVTVFPNTGTAEFRLGIFIPALAAIVFGPLNGGLIAGVGNLLIDAYNVLDGTTPEYDLSRLLGAVANFIGAYFTGWVAQQVRGRTKEHDTLINWRYVLPYTVASILGMGLLTGIGIGYLIVYSYLHFSLNAAMSISLTIFFYNSVVLIVFIPISLAVYWSLAKYKAFIFAIVDKKNRKIKVFKTLEAISIKNILLPKHSLWSEQWSPLTVTIRNNLKREHRFVFESVGNCAIYPTIDVSPPIQPKASFTQTFYVMPRQEESVSIRILVHPEENETFKQQHSNRSIAEIRANTTKVRETDSLTQFSSVNIIVFILSILWSNVITTLRNGYSSTSEQWTLVTVIAVAEIVLFVPFLMLQYRTLKQRAALKEEFPQSFISDLTSHRIEKITDVQPTQTSLTAQLVQLAARVINLVLILVLIYHSYLYVYQEESGFLTGEENLFIIVILLFTLFSELFMHLYFVNPIQHYDIGVHKVLIAMETKQQFKINEPNEVMLTLTNPTKHKGLRVQLQGKDMISPERLELHLEPNEVAKVKIYIVPTYIGLTELLVIASPLFDKKGKYLDYQEVEPLFYQRIDYETLNETVFGMTEEQFETVKKLGTFGTLIATGLVLISRYIGIDNIILAFRDAIPALFILQIPFVYVYFTLNNRFKSKLSI